MKIKKIAQTPGLVATVVDNLESTSTTDALSANQGKVLNESKIEKSQTIKQVDLNTIDDTCFNYCNDCTNAPVGTNGYLFTHKYATTYIYQRYVCADGSSGTYERFKKNGTWGEWIQTGNIITITNENGTAIKYPDGTMICKHTIIGNSFACTANLQGRYYFTDANNSTENHKVWTFPQEFISRDDLVVDLTVSSSAYSMASIGSKFTTYVQGYCVLPYPVDSISFHWDFIAIGRWK